MHNHEPENYRCPLCAVVNSEEGDFPYTKTADIVYRNNFVTAFIASHWWPKNKGHVIIIPNEHIENIYDISDDILSKIHILAKKLSIIMKDEYKCDGISTRQHNEPHGSQDVWHFHLHIFPRYEGDKLYLSDEQKYLSKPEERTPFAEKLKKHLT